MAAANGKSGECPECGRVFTVQRAWQRFCSDAHRSRWWNRQRAERLAELEAEIKKLKGGGA